MVESWKLAYNLINSANRIRIVGYSLPVSDSYVRHLLKTARRTSQDLKRIDVIVHDADVSVERRYREFIDFKGFRFKNCLFEVFLNLLSKRLSDYVQRFGIPDAMPFDQIEDTH